MPPSENKTMEIESITGPSLLWKVLNYAFEPKLLQEIRSLIRNWLLSLTVAYEATKELTFRLYKHPN